MNLLFNLDPVATRKANSHTQKFRRIRRGLWGSVFLILFAVTAEARIGVILMESVPGTAGYVSQGGHTAIFLSETCTDDFVSLRPCTPTDPIWGVIAERTASFSEKAKYDWLVMPVSLSLFALEDRKQAPLIINPHLRKKLIERFYFSNTKFRNMVVNSDPEFEKGMKLSEGYGFPKGRWQNVFGSQLRRSLFVIWIHDKTGTKERQLVEAINGFSNRPKYSTLLFLFAGNCSKWVKESLSKIEGMKEAGFGHNWGGDAVFSSPKGIAEEAFEAARRIMAKNSDVFVTVELLPQIAGTYPKSNEPYYVVESVFRNKLVWPVIAYFHPIVYLIGRFYFRFIKRFSIYDKYANYFSYEAASLSIGSKERKYQGSKKKEMKRLRAEFFGTEIWWKQKKRDFLLILKRVKTAELIPKISYVEKGVLLKRILDREADLKIDENGAPWLVRPGNEGRPIRAGLTLVTVDKGDFTLGFEIMLARIQWHLKQKNYDKRLPAKSFQPEWDKLLRFVRRLDDTRLAVEIEGKVN